MKRLFVFVCFCVSPLVLCADVFTMDTVCTWTPWDYGFYDLNGNWFSECDGQSVTGISLCASQGGVVGDVSRKQPTIDTSENRDPNNVHCWCKMTVPYEGLWVYRGTYTTLEQYCDGSSSEAMFLEYCSVHCAEMWLAGNSGNAFLDAYQRGFGGTATELDAIKAGLFSPTSAEVPCEIGISKLKVSNGLAFQLWAEKYTEPALVVQYNDEKCYVKLDAGLGKLNINFNGQIYHAID